MCVCVWVCTLACGTHRSQKRGSDPLELELREAHEKVDVGNWTKVLCKNSTCFQLLSHRDTSKLMSLTCSRLLKAVVGAGVLRRWGLVVKYVTKGELWKVTPAPGLSLHYFLVLCDIRSLCHTLLMPWQTETL